MHLVARRPMADPAGVGIGVGEGGLTGSAAAATFDSPAGRTAASLSRRGGKSGLHGRTVPGNARRGRPQGKRHRKQTPSPSRLRAASPEREAGEG